MLLSNIASSMLWGMVGLVALCLELLSMTYCFLWIAGASGGAALGIVLLGLSPVSSALLFLLLCFGGLVLSYRPHWPADDLPVMGIERLVGREFTLPCSLHVDPCPIALEGSYWRCRSVSPLKAGSHVRVVRIESITLWLQAAEAATASYHCPPTLES